MRNFTILLVLAVAAWFAPGNCQAQESLERGLLREAPRLIKYFQQHGYKNVGVLKFLVAREGQKFTDNVGAFNELAARRLEMALILANDPVAPIGIIDNASDTAQKIAGASHLSKAGRLKLLSARYPLAWGKESVAPDAFVTGTIEISKDLRKLTLTLLCFDSQTNMLGQVPPPGRDLQVANAAGRLAEMNESYLLRGAFDDGKIDADAKNQEKAYHEAANVYQQKEKHPLQRADLPVTLEVLYDGRAPAYQYRGGRAYIPEARAGQRIEFGLRRDASKERYGVVIKVNGENTLGQQRLPDAACQMWVLEPGRGNYLIRGFHNGDKLRKFHVASQAQSRELEMNYGRDIGTITMTVFRERKIIARPKRFDDPSELAVKKVAQLKERPQNFGALKAMLLEDANRDIGRGLIIPGADIYSKLETVPFIADPTPMMTISIIYYRPQRGPGI
jgi:hypothetical protein